MRIYGILFAAVTMAFSTSCNSKKKNTEKPTDDSQIIDSHTSENALDWNGTYKGTLPCADCEGIKSTITLNQDLTYTAKNEYLGKKDGAFESKGNFTWSADGRKIILDNSDKNSYFVGENKLTLLDTSGDIIEGDLASLYILEKLKTAEIAFTDTKWKLVTLFGKEIKSNEAFITFSTEDNRFFGNNSCNNFNGSFEIKNGSQLKLSEAATTMMACADTATEKQFMEALNTADNFSLNDNTMTLNKARMAPLAIFKAME